MGDTIREILLLHHSHLDVGFTHSQPIVWEMHREFIDQALRLLADTAEWPPLSQPKWTCEVTEPLLRWLDCAGGGDLERFKAFLRQGRIGICAMRYNTSSLCGAELLKQQLAPVPELRRKLGARIAVAIQHDVNGVPWPFADLLIDAGIELLTMGVNPDHGRPVLPRPGVFLWTAPSGRRLLVMNGNAYTMFDQLLRTWDNSVARMREGFMEYAAYLEQKGYPHDFLYLTTTNPPEAWDNSPPNPWVAELVREWNQTAGSPRIRYVTPEDLLSRLREIPPASLPVLRGDWTDYWSFGIGSSAHETAVSRDARFCLERAELLQAFRPAAPGRPLLRVRGKAWDRLSLYCEHTWTSWDPAPENPASRAQSRLKDALAHEARELAAYLLIEGLEDLARNPFQSQRPDHLLIVNLCQRARCANVRLPAGWLEPGKRLRARRFTPEAQKEAGEGGIAYGPFQLPAFGWKMVHLGELVRAAPSPGIRLEEGGRSPASIESPYHRLSFDRSTGRVVGLLDKRLGWEVLPPGGQSAFFEPVRERPDPSADASRKAFYERDLDREKLDQSCWKTEWKAERQALQRVISCTAFRDEDSVSLVRELSGPGLDLLRQRITLRADSDVIELEALLQKQDQVQPEAFYFAFPLNLPAGWRGHFDTAGVPVEIDAEQLAGSCRGWMSVDTFAALHAPGRCAALVCRDSTLVMPGGFFFGRLLSEVPRNPFPLLLAWPLNNYWYTNFPLTQPGIIRVRYGFLTAGAFEAADLMTRAVEVIHPLIVHPAFCVGREPEGRFLVVEGKGVLVNHVGRAADERGIVVRLVNVGDTEAMVRFRLGGAPVGSAWVCGTLEDDRLPLPLVDGMAQIKLQPRALTLVRLCPEHRNPGAATASGCRGGSPGA